MVCLWTLLRGESCSGSVVYLRRSFCRSLCQSPGVTPSERRLESLAKNLFSANTSARTTRVHCCLRRQPMRASGSPRGSFGYFHGNVPCARRTGIERMHRAHRTTTGESTVVSSPSARAPARARSGFVCVARRRACRGSTAYSDEGVRSAPFRSGPSTREAAGERQGPRGWERGASSSERVDDLWLPYMRGPGNAANERNGGPASGCGNE